MNEARPRKNTVPSGTANRRINVWYGALILIFIVTLGRLFYLQIVKYDHYRHAALADQLKEYAIPAERGIIEAHEGDSIVPLALNQKLYTIYADPSFIKDAYQTAQKVAGVIGGDAKQFAAQMRTPHSRYQILAKRISQADEQKLLNLKLPGIGAQAQDYRTYPQGELAAQVLGFVNDAGQGNYGVEQALNDNLSGKPGMLKAITDASGVPLVASRDNTKIAPINGQNVVLTLDLGMQAQLEKILASEYQKTQSKGLSAVVMDTGTGRIKAMANWPTYDPAKYQDVSDQSLFQNAAVTNAIEPGSTMKNLTTAAALDMGVIKPDTTFYDPAHWVVDGFNITDIEEDGGAGVKSIGDILNLSLNTGATWMLMQMGGGQLDQQGRDRWHDYMVNHFRLGRPTNIEQGYESAGYIPNPDQGYGLDLTYANTSFGQGVTITPVQMAAALSSVLNGGTYYQPELVDSYQKADGTTKNVTPNIIKKGVVKPKVSQEMMPLMEYVVAQHLNPGGFSYLNFPSNYSVGGKTGTAQIANPAGGYYSNRYNGTYAGWVGGDKPQYVIIVYNIEPNVPGYAGTYGGQVVFADIAHMLINGSYVTPKTGT